MAKVIKLTTKQKILKTLSQPNTTLTVAQARTRFNVKNVSQRITELRKDGHPIQSILKQRKDGRKVAVYSLAA